MAITLEPDPNPDITALHHAVYEWKTYRFLLNDGRFLDVRAIHDDSVLRVAVLAHTGAQKIEGVAWLKDPEPAVEEPPKRAPVKRRTRVEA
jgi:hypothetical protein